MTNATPNDGSASGLQSPAQPVKETLAALARWRVHIIGQVDHQGVITKVKDESGWSPRYGFMIAMSGGIAILGLLLSSPAVVIGAMLVAPLMGPILGAGFALATGDTGWMRSSTRNILIGSLIAILLCAFIVLVSPLKTVTEEIAARTRPNLFDLAVAIFSSLAGSYAMIRGREGTIVGVAIATALMPPLAVVGFGLATWNWTVFGGALLLFFTNLMTIALTAAVMARVYGFSRRLTSKQSLTQTIIVCAVFVGLAIPLGYSLNQIAWESNASRQATNIVADQFGPMARVSDLSVDFDSSPMRVTASVLTPEFLPQAEQLASRLLSRQLDWPMEVTINQYRVGTESGDAEAAELLAARAKEQAAASERAITRLADRLALIAGVSTEKVLIDSQQNRAVVKAAPLPGASLETYYALERRVAGLEPEWTLLVRPPAVDLPNIPLGTPEDEEEEWNAEALRRLTLAGWAGQRIDAPIGVGGEEEGAERVIAALRSRGATAVRKTGQSAPAGQVSLVWLPPSEAPDDETPVASATSSGGNQAP